MKKTIYLDTAGDDRNDGSRKHPVASLAQAVSLSRALPAGRRRIVAAPGRYWDTEAVLTAADSGLELTAGRGDTAPQFYGGTPISGWRPEGGRSPFWITAMPGARDGSRDFRMLVVNGRVAPRARFPETGAIRHASEFPVRWMSTTKGGWERKPTESELATMRIVPGSLPTGLALRNAELTIYHCWDESLVGIRDWDHQTNTLVFSTPAGHPAGAFGDWKAQARTFVVWNIREGMSHPGQWFLDRENGRIVYWPRDDENIESLDVIAPTRDAVLRLVGNEASPVADIYIKGLTIGVTTTPLLAGGFGAGRFGGAIEGAHAHDLRLDDVTIRWSGGQGARIQKSNGLRCKRCTVHDTGAGGLVFSGQDGLVTETLIHHNGRCYPSALGLNVHGENWRLSRNTLHHTPYSAIVAGGKNLRIEYNRFHHVMEELLDGAAIYVFAAKECRLRGNYTSDVRDEQAHAYYLDEQSENSLVEGNVAEGVPWPIHNHMAWNCTIRNNVCICKGDMRITFPNCDGFRLAKNVFACGGTLIFEPSYTGVGILDHNAFFSESGSCRWSFHDRLPSLERNVLPTPVVPRNAGSVIANLGCRCAGGKISFDNAALAGKLGLRAPDVSRAGCGRE